MSLPKFFKWNSQTSPKEYLDALNSAHYRSKIENFTSAIFPENREGIEQTNKILTDIICGAAKVSLPTKRIKKYKTHKPKKWFNKDCQKQGNCLNKLPTKVICFHQNLATQKRKLSNLKNLKRYVKFSKRNFGIIG